MTMFKETVVHDGELLEAFCEALKCGNAKNVEQLFTVYLQKTVSIRDTFVRKNIKENLPSGKATTTGSKRQNPSVCFYHGILLGILGFKGDWYVISNRQSGDGYSDIQVVIDREEIGLVIEVKYAQNMDLESECAKAIDQINKNRYTKELHDDGIATIFKYGIVCHKNRCRVAVEKEEQST